MAIVAYTGLPRSGKSYSAVAHQIVPALEAGRPVVTNIPLDMERIRVDFPAAVVSEVTNADLVADGFFVDSDHDGAVLVLDELWRLWPSGLKANQAKEEHKAFLAEHGHRVDSEGRTTQIVLITQDLGQVAAWVRALVAVTYRTHKLSTVGADTRYRVDVYDGPMAGPNPPAHSRVNELFGKYSESVWRYYKSAMYSQTGNVGEEKTLDKRGSLWRNKKFLACLILPLILFGYSAWSLPGLFNLSPEVEAQPDPVTPPATAQQTLSFAADPDPVPAPPPEPAAPRGPQESERWRLAGLIQGEERWAVLRGPHGVVRRVEDPDCRNAETLQTATCRVGGEVVAAWTGPQRARRLGVVNSDTEGRVRHAGGE